MPNRDRAVEQWLRHAPLPGAGADVCLDADTLAAWAEGGLDPHERSTAEAHAANCGRCQAMLAVMVRTAPAPAPSAGSPLRKWLTMLAPVTAAAAAVALWFAVDGREPRPSVVDSLTSQQTKAELAPSAPAAAPPTELDRQREQVSPDRGGRSAPADAAAKQKQLGNSLDKTLSARQESKDNELRKERSDLAAAKPVGGLADRAERRIADAPPVAASPSLPPPPSAPLPRAVAAPTVVEVPPASQQVNQNLNQAANQAPNVNQAQGVNQQAPSVNQQSGVNQSQVATTQAAQGVAETVATDRNRAALESKPGTQAGRGGAVAGFSGARVAGNVPPTFDVVVAESSVRWRVADGRLVQRSLDLGITWTGPQTVDPAGVLTAGAAPSSVVCWLVGRAGTVLVTTDAVKWQRVSFPETVDLTAVTSSDARSAIVLTVDGRRFATADGGRTWARR